MHKKEEIIIMDRELTQILRNLKQKTGISVDVYSSAMVYLYSSGEKISFESDGKYTDGYQDKKQNVTVFRFRFKKDLYYGVLTGADAVEHNYALLICAHLENSGIQEDSLPKEDFLRSIVLGDCSGLQIMKYMRKFSVPPVPCYVLSVVSKGAHAEEISDFLESYTINGLDTAVTLNENSCIFVKYLTGESDSEYQSPIDFAEIFAQSLFEETGVSVQVGVGGTVRSLSDAVQSYNQAESALKTSELFNSKSQVHSYKEFILYEMLEELPSAKISAYFDMLADADAKRLFADEDMMNTAEEFLNDNLNVSETARKIYMHRNTLTYRLDKIARATGLDIRNFSDAVTFRINTVLYKMINKK